MRKLRLFLTVILGIIGFLLVLMVGGTLLLNNDSFQNKMLKLTTEMLSERLGTRVTIDSIHFNVFRQQVELYGVNVEDQQQRKMLQVNLLELHSDLMALRRHEVIITKATLSGCRALIVRSDTDSVPNYQFIIDSLKRKEPVEKSEGSAEEGKTKKKLSLDADNVTVEDLSVQYNGNGCQLGLLKLRYKKDGSLQAELKDVTAQWQSKNKKGVLVDHAASLYHLTFTTEDGRRQLSMDSLCFKTDNHLPRKNTGKRHRGAFDVGHLDICADVKATVDHLAHDSLVATVTASAHDLVTGIDLRNLSLKMAANKEVAHVEDVVIQQGRTTLKFDKGEIRLPSKKKGRTLAFSTSTIRGRVLLQDISKPFAPVLSKFVQPLDLSLRMSGTDNALTFSDIHVFTPDKQLQIKAAGGVTNLKDSRQLVVRFHVNDMFAKKGSKQKIISQFPVKKLMMKQLSALGDIRYRGDLTVLWRKEQFAGLLSTNVGQINFQFTIDETSKYVFGSAHSQAIHVGKVFDLPDIGVASCKAGFKVDISKPRTAQLRRLKGGKLPIGSASVQVEEVSYKKIKVRNVNVDVTSDGALADGSLTTRGRHMDLSCNFSFTNTDEMKKMKISNPGIKIHKMSEEDREKKAEEKALKKLLREKKKEQRKQEKARLKELRRQEKERLKAK